MSLSADCCCCCLCPGTAAEPQYQSYQLLLAEVSLFTARIGHNAYRPRMRPAAGKSARTWWRYAAQAVLQQRLALCLTWRQAVRVRSGSVCSAAGYAELHLFSVGRPARTLVTLFTGSPY